MRSTLDEVAEDVHGAGTILGTDLDSVDELYADCSRSGSRFMQSGYCIVISDCDRACLALAARQSVVQEYRCHLSE